MLVLTTCAYCEKPIEKQHWEIGETGNSFCNSSCAASFNNVGICRNDTGKNGRGGKKKREHKNCLSCDKALSGKHWKQKYCNHGCSSEHKTKKTYQAFEDSGFIRDTQRTAGRRYLISVRGHRCEICGLEEWNDKPTPLVMDHIDGHSEHGQLENLRMICPNCDAQLPTYKGANRGNGRPHRYDAKVPSL